jgi:hypothetical protein
MNAYRAVAGLWDTIKWAIARRTGLYRLDVAAMRRSARRLEEVATLARSVGLDDRAAEAAASAAGRRATATAMIQAARQP